MKSLLLALLLAFSNSSEAGSICNDGTYSYSEGRGTCSWHGGVAVSGVYPNAADTSTEISYQSRSDVNNDQVWEEIYSTADDGTPFHSVSKTTNQLYFSYTCYVVDLKSVLESILLIIPMSVADEPEFFPAPKEHIKVFAHTPSGHSLISGAWTWSAKDGNLIIRKTKRPLGQSELSLTKTDMTKILLADYFVVSVEGQKDTKILTPGVGTKIVSTWSKCNASVSQSGK